MLIVIAALAAACGDGSRQSFEDWQTHWAAAQALVPERADLGPAPNKDECSRVHVALRKAQPDLLRTPDPALDDPVRDWISTAQAIFFECPPHEPGLRGFDQAYEALALLTAEIEIVIAIDLEEGAAVSPKTAGT